MQLSLPILGTLPAGLVYRPDFITPDEERDLLAGMDAVAFAPFKFQQYTGLREVAYFGLAYDFAAGRLAAAEPMPAFLLPLRERAAGLIGRQPEALPHVLINRYAPGAPIGWHRDRPQFDEVVGISLAAPARMRFRRKDGARWERRDLILAPRSAYVLSGEARSVWEHSIPPAEALRYSITFRTLR